MGPCLTSVECVSTYTCSEPSVCDPTTRVPKVIALELAVPSGFRKICVRVLALAVFLSS
jgi:hypothetical protein